MHGHFLWNELMTRDVEAACAYYGRTLGWTFEKRKDLEADYTVAYLNGKAVAGLFDISPAEFAHLPPHWFAYVGVDDVDAFVTTAVEAGAKVVHAPFDVPNVGRIALLTDPTGATLGYYKPA